MRKYFDMMREKAGKAHGRMSEYWRRLMNHSNHTKMSEGSQEINKIITSAHKDEWRRKDK